MRYGIFGFVSGLALALSYVVFAQVVSPETPAQMAPVGVSVASLVPLDASSTPILEKAELNGVTGDTSFLLSASDTNTGVLASRLDTIISLLKTISFKLNKK